MIWQVGPVPASAPAELARFLRQKAEECLRLARATAEESAAKELLVMAASLHDRALRLEGSLAPEAGREASQTEEGDRASSPREAPAPKE